MMYKVQIEKNVIKWISKLPDSEADSILELIKMLSIKGHELGYPYSKNLKVSGVKLKELRCTRYGNRVYYIFLNNSSLYICLGSGDKDSQKQDIKEARKKALLLGG